MRDQEVWNHILSCHPDDVEAEFPFSTRLARDNGWSARYAARVVVEYQRFAYLSRVGTGMVTPSDEVDQAWHLHLTYTRHYWGPFTEALGGALHHMPTKGGPDQGKLFRDAYEATLNLYRSEFGEPPADIWPPTDIRFGKAPHFKRVNTRDVWMIRKPKAPELVLNALRRVKSVPAAAFAACLGFLSLLFGTGLAFAHGEPAGDTLIEKFRNMLWHWASEHTFLFALGVFIVCFALVAILNKSAGKNSGCGSSGCSSGGSGSSGCGGCGN